jgi:AraC-like DNA-binding protein
MGLVTLSYVSVVNPFPLMRLLRRTPSIMEPTVSNPFDQQLELSVHAYRLLAVLKRSIDRPPPSPVVARVLDCIESRLSEQASVDLFARVAGTSRETLTRLFTAETGMSPYRYYIGRKMLLAQEYMTGDGLSVKEAALAVGYDNQLYFSRLFRRHMGVPPSQVKASE